MTPASSVLEIGAGSRRGASSASGALIRASDGLHQGALMAGELPANLGSYKAATSGSMHPEIQVT